MAYREDQRGDVPKVESAAEFVQQMNQGRNLERSGKYAEARSIYERLIARYPERYEAYHRLGVVSDREKRFAEAQALYGRAIRLNPKNPDLHNDLGYSLFLQGQLEKAEAAVGTAVQIAPANPRYHNNLGMILGHQRRFDEALEQFRRGGSEADAFYNLAFVLAAKGDAEGARNCFRMALRADPGYEQARRALESIDRTAENQRPSPDNAPAQVSPGGQVRAEAAQPAERYDAQPASLTVSADPRSRDPREPVLFR